MLVRQTHDDESFIRKYLDEEMCNELNLFSYSYQKNTGNYAINEIIEAYNDELDLFERYHI